MKPRVCLPAVLAILSGTGWCASGVGRGAVGPAGQPGDVLGRKFMPVTKEDIQANRKLAQDWADKAKRTVVKSMHLIETDHFLIYSAWGRGNDAALKRICEKLYAALCKQFAIPRGQNIWAGKCPIYAFWEKEHYLKFCKDVNGAGKRSPSLLQAAGYSGQRGSFTYVVLNKVRTRQWFYELLVHETTHAFLARYLTNRHVLPWVNEGLAEYMAATLVPGSRASRKYVSATKEAVKGRKDVAHVFKKVTLNAFDYGIAQSFVRYLIHRDRKAFIKFVGLVKQGSSDAEALQGAYGLSREQFLKAWWKAVGRKK